MRIFIFFLVFSLPVQAEVWGLDTVFNFSKTEQSLIFNGSSARYKLGGIGLLGKYQSKNYGNFFVGGGLGYSPNESASFLSVTASGSATSVFKQIAYDYQLQFSDSMALNFQLNHRDYDIEGDLKGVINNQSLSVDASSRFKLNELILSIPIRVNQRNTLEFGVGLINWQIDATAKGQLESGISAKTFVEGSATDPLFMLGLQTKLLDTQLIFTYKNSKFSADEETAMHEILVTAKVASF
mgnify:CR=1 FL=1|jgi:hypothetical protein